MTRTHQERAKEAAGAAATNYHDVCDRSPGVSDNDLADTEAKTARDVARLTYPTELVHAASKALRCQHKGAGVCPECTDRLVDALTPYETKEAP